MEDNNKVLIMGGSDFNKEALSQAIIRSKRDGGKIEIASDTRINEENNELLEDFKKSIDLLKEENSFELTNQKSDYMDIKYETPKKDRNIINSKSHITYRENKKIKNRKKRKNKKTHRK